ncbi:AI-2E family transporter [Paenibacillus marchantiophytorum]|uniref:AI-2E family transporter n=1 Tax=Paenibacillus marchantiophytorum TaxID=1619310 RepID=A0ABQ2BQ63_9BACL|nr:AI-2E family transporter [Paenibacillus marchantiophytorum]GGI44961.1 AI-2E family transporter [Paenibacillus marchantiophytorum]
MNIKAILQKKEVQRFAVLALFCLVLYFIRSMLNLVLLTFLLTFLMNRLHQYSKRWIEKIVPVNSKFLLALIYGALLTLLIVAGTKFFPALVRQIAQLFELVRQLYDNPQNEVAGYITTWLDSLDLPSMVKPGFDFMIKIGNLGFQAFLALMLSLFLLLGKENVIRFTAQFHTSKLGWFSREVEFFGKKLVQTFGKVIEAQLLIALINSLLTTFALWLMGFPNLIGLALLIYVLGLVPVAGVFLSLIPLSMIAFSLGGFTYIIYLVVAVTIIHAVEAYMLNPRLMASKTHLPVFYTFLVLLFSEHFFGIWGLIIGIPTFVFLLDILDIQKTEKTKLSNT